MSPTLPGYDLVAELRPGRTALLRDRGTGRRVVCKRLLPDARAAERRLVALGPLASGWALAACDGAPCLVRPFLAGRSLAERLRDGPAPRAEGDVARVVLALASILAPLHARGIAHGELHPGNVVETEDGRLALVDGVEPFRGAPEGDALAAAEAAWAAPEVIRGAASSPASDVWSLGVLARQLLSGAHPFEAGEPAATVARILYDAPLGIALARPELAPAFAAALDRATARRPRRRLRSAVALAEALS
ncbi:MAG TPA: protein kinase, partial [Anaeromyxobacteraceae bacterium]|nr:protein kinase [Anaeromyxobacteraceae bacterium]